MDELKIAECLRCGHKWALRKAIYDSPACCPKCGSPRWNQPRIERDKAGDKRLKNNEVKQ